MDAAEVYVVKRSEVALVIRDVSKSDDAGNVLVGAQVKLTSRFNGASLEGTTDGRGGVLFDIAKLAEDGGKGEKPARYAFNGTIIISKD